MIHRVDTFSGAVFMCSVCKAEEKFEGLAVSLAARAFMEEHSACGVTVAHPPDAAPPLVATAGGEVSVGARLSHPLPTIGRIVIYTARGSADGVYKPEPRAAIVTALRGGYQIDACVFNPTGLFFNREVQFSPEPSPGCWSWPTRQP